MLFKIFKKQQQGNITMKEDSVGKHLEFKLN